MANVTVKCVLELNNGALIADMESTIAEGSTSEVLTSTRYASSAQSLGVYADGMTITRVLVPALSPNGASFAYVNRNGAVAALIPVAVQGQVAHDGGAVGFTIRAGDTLQVHPITAASRQAALSVKTREGTCAIFTVTPSGAAENSLTHILTGQTFGESLVGQVPIMHSLTSKDGANLSTGGVLYLNNNALPVGGVIAVNPQAQQVEYQTSGGGFRVGLNFVARLQTSA